MFFYFWLLFSDAFLLAISKSMLITFSFLGTTIIHILNTLRANIQLNRFVDQGLDGQRIEIFLGRLSVVGSGQLANNFLEDFFIIDFGEYPS